jgi:two-component system response regulator RegX3
VGNGVATTRILIVEDEPALADAMRYGLEREGFRCSVAPDGSSALNRYRTEQPHLVVLDLMLPGVPGEEICRSIRRADSTPIIIVSAKSSEVDRVLGLELGADDYLTKPFSTRELVARIRTVLRRGSGPVLDAPARVTVGHIEVDSDRHEVTG